MSTVDSDTAMIVAGMLLSLVVAAELYPMVKRIRANRVGD
jgi:hypothetical protein